MRRTAIFAAVFVLAGCGAGSNGFHDVTSRDGSGDGSQGIDGTGDDSGDDTQSGDADDGADADVTNLYDVSTGTDGCVPDTGACTPVPSGCGASEICNNGLDDNCNMMVDEGCPCIPGTVQDCFLGPPGSRHAGACRDGTQRCEGSGEFGTWGDCTGGISPSPDRCDGLDNACTGCAETSCCNMQIDCPGPGDPRVPDGTPFADYPLHGNAFYPMAARAWQWSIVGGPCDTLLPRPTYSFTGATTADPVFHPTLSGDYTVTLTVTAMDGTMYTCTFVVHIAGPGLRVELCWDTSTTVDLDLYLHDPSMMGPWFDSNSDILSSVNNNSCNWSNCEAVIRGSHGRENWGLANSPLTACQNGPHGPDWRALGYCSNPRLDIDNNLAKSSGTPENINVDNPHDAQRFRIMVQNFTGTNAHPMINVYCGGHLRGTLGAAPDTVAGYMGSSGYTSVGAMWRAADVTVHVDASGTTTGCDVAPLHPAGMTSGYDVTFDNPAY